MVSIVSVPVWLIPPFGHMAKAEYPSGRMQESRISHLSGARKQKEKGAEESTPPSREHLH